MHSELSDITSKDSLYFWAILSHELNLETPVTPAEEVSKEGHVFSFVYVPGMNLDFNPVLNNDGGILGIPYLESLAPIFHRNFCFLE